MELNDVKPVRPPSPNRSWCRLPGRSILFQSLNQLRLPSPEPNTRRTILMHAESPVPGVCKKVKRSIYAKSAKANPRSLGPLPYELVATTSSDSVPGRLCVNLESSVFMACWLTNRAPAQSRSRRSWCLCCCALGLSVRSCLESTSQGDFPGRLRWSRCDIDCRRVKAAFWTRERLICNVLLPEY